MNIECVVCKNQFNATKNTAQTCSPACRNKLSRKKKSAVTLTPDKGSVTPENDTPETGGGVTPEYTKIGGVKVYGRQAVSFPDDRWETRPEPDYPGDIPSLDGRCIYEGRHRYIVDVTGKSINLTSERLQPANFGKEDCECMHCQSNRKDGSKNIINHGTHKSASELAEHEVNRVSLPGDADYQGADE